MGSLQAADSLLRYFRRQAEQFDFLQGYIVITLYALFFVGATSPFFFSVCFVFVLFCVFQGMDNWYLFLFYFGSLYQFCLVIKFVGLCLLLLYFLVFGISSIYGDECPRCVVARRH